MPFTEELPLSMQETYPQVAIQDAYNYFTLNIYATSISGSPGPIHTGSVSLNGMTELWVKYSTSASASTCSSARNRGHAYLGILLYRRGLFDNQWGWHSHNHDHREHTIEHLCPVRS